MRFPSTPNDLDVDPSRRQQHCCVDEHQRDAYTGQQWNPLVAWSVLDCRSGHSSTSDDGYACHHVLGQADDGRFFHD